MTFRTDRASLLRDLYRYMNIDASDGAATEHDSSSNEGLYLLLQDGAEDAQTYLLDRGLAAWWLTTSAVLTFTTDSFSRRYSALPADFLRAVGDDMQTSALHNANGIPWGREIPAEGAWKRRGNQYWIQGSGANDQPSQQRLYFPVGVQPPADLYLDYYRRIGTLADGTTVDCPPQDLGLIVAFAADRGRKQDWFTGGPNEHALIKDNLEDRKLQAQRRARRTLTPQRVNVPEVRGDHWFL